MLQPNDITEYFDRKILITKRPKGFFFVCFLLMQSIALEKNVPFIFVYKSKNFKQNLGVENGGSTYTKIRKTIADNR